MLTAHQAIKVMRVLVIDPLEERRDSIVSRLKYEGFEHVQCAGTGEDALRLLATGLGKREPTDLVLLSINLPDRPGLECFHEIRNVFDVCLVLLTDRDDRALALE